MFRIDLNYVLKIVSPLRISHSNVLDALQRTIEKPPARAGTPMGCGAPWGVPALPGTTPPARPGASHLVLGLVGEGSQRRAQDAASLAAKPGPAKPRRLPARKAPLNLARRLLRPDLAQGRVLTLPSGQPRS